jgi:cytochrome c553
LRIRGFTSLITAGLVVVFTQAGCSRSAPPPAETQAPSPEAQVERGRALVTTGLCHDCHTPKKDGPKGPEPDTDRMLSGHPEDLAVGTVFAPAAGSPWTIATNDRLTAWSGPWGISYAANLTPDTLTGLRSGVWTEELFIKALRTGKHMGTSRDILPPMPWMFIGQLGDDDLKAIWAYLGSIPPVRNHVPDPVPAPGAPVQ